ncbi:MAG: EAL domain-containing protein [Aestuariivirga sp.]
MIESNTLRILVVDDDDDDLYLINDALAEVKDTRYAVEAVTSALAAMSKLVANTYDTIICDYRLGAVTGVDFIRNLRAAGVETPVILLTGLAAHTVDRAALEAGASDFLPKGSLSPVVLDRSIRYAMAHADRQRLLQAVLRSTTSGIAVLNSEGRITLWNPRFLEFAQSAFGEESDRLDQIVALVQNAVSKDVIAGDRVVEWHRTALPDGDTVLALHDVTARVTELKERERAEQRIRKIAMTDALTGLPNRMAFNDRLDRSIADAAANGTRIAVLSFDFDRFKEVNDLFGHAAGDELLRSTSERLGRILSSREYVARLGGDEFVMIHDFPDSESTQALSDRLVNELSRPIEWDGRVVEAGVSVGISYFPEHGQERDTLLANADLAMYRAKCDTGRSVCIFDASMDQFVRERRKIALDLRRAIQDNELSLYFQPQYAAGDGELAGFEALLRWKSRTRGFVSPADFILIAEENGMINEIDEWVIRQACQIASKWESNAKVAVNISAKAICHAGVTDTVRNIILETGLSPSRLELEVTETALIHDLNRALHNLRQIKALGISIAMDDFGTGYSSLSLLNSFPFDRIKIDKSFIQAIGQTARADTIFRAVVGLGTALQVPVLVEGVETREQLDFARAQGCNEFQGYYFGRPVPEAETYAIASGRAQGNGDRFQSAADGLLEAVA